MRAALSDTGDSLSEAAACSIAKALNVTERDVRRMADRLRGPDWSLDERRGEDDETSWLEDLPDTGTDPEQSLIRSDELRYRLGLLTGALAQLKDRERLIITRRYLSEVAVTLEGLGKELGISKERVRQIEARAMAKLRAIITPRIDTGATA